MSRAGWTRQPEPDRRPASGVDQSDPSAVRLDDAREVANPSPVPEPDRAALVPPVGAG